MHLAVGRLGRLGVLLIIFLLMPTLNPAQAWPQIGLSVYAQEATPIPPTDIPPATDTPDLLPPPSPEPFNDTITDTNVVSDTPTITDTSNLPAILPGDILTDNLDAAPFTITDTLLVSETPTPAPSFTPTPSVTPTRRPPLVNVQPVQVARDVTSSLILSAIYATVGLGVSFLARRIVHRLMAQVHPTVQTFATKVTFYGILAITGIAILRAWNIESSNLAAILASLGLAVSLSFQDLFRNIIAGVFLLIERPFETGDKLTIGLVTGRVLLVDLRATTLITEDGQRVYVPNQRMISDVVIREQQEKQMEEDQVGKTPRPGGEDSQG